MQKLKLTEMTSGRLQVPKMVSVYSPRGTDWSAYVSAGIARELSVRDRVLLVSCSDDASQRKYFPDFFEDLGFDAKKNLEIKTVPRYEYEPDALKEIFEEALGLDFVIFDAPRGLSLLPTLRNISDKFVFVIRDYPLSFDHTIKSLEYLQKNKKDVHIIVADCVNPEYTREIMSKPPFSDYAASSSIIPICRELENEGVERILANRNVRRAVQIACEYLFDYRASVLE